MKTLTLRTIPVIFLFALLLVGCNFSAGATPTQNIDVAYTQAAQTVVALLTSPAPTSQPTTAVTPTPPPVILATATPIASPTSAPTATPTTQLTATAQSCTDMVEFVDDVTVPDNTEMLPGQEFIKTWRLQNAGTCTWTTQYSLVFIDGDQMNGISPSPLVGSITPGGTVDISIGLKAPGTAGTYRGDWELRNANGVNFGLGTDAADPFYVQIKVVEGASELNLGNPTWRDNLNNADNWYLLNTANTKFTEGDGRLVMTSKNPGVAEEWGLSNQPEMKDYYLQATFITGDTCSGYDKYGVLVRAPDTDKGYVYEFSCDGHYRLYTWDGQNYHALQEWRSTSSVLPGPNQTNVMGIWLQGTTIKLYANGHKIAEFTDSTFDEGQFGLVIGSVETNDFTVYVDEIAYWKFDQ